MNNWKPVIGSLLKVLQDHNFTLVSVDNGDGRVSLAGMTPRQARQLAKNEINATDDSHLWVSHPSHERKLWLYVVLGNEPEETVADYTVNTVLELALEQFENKWKNKPVPTR